ncbi:MAG: glycosyltransferase family 2 protein [Planctomycetales bacterium]|nr:glycosyltransferase family 2 protein [Planctomycetales bacterium]
MTKLSIIIVSHNEGDLLWKTVKSCCDTCDDIDCEILVIDDASTDKSIDELARCKLDVKVYPTPSRQGPSPSKDYGVSVAKGDVFLFLDAHCKPESGAIERLLAANHETDGQAAIIPKISKLDVEAWVNDDSCAGYGYAPRLADDITKWDWIPREKLKKRGRFLESPGFPGCASMISRGLYEKLWGFDREMMRWGAEDVDLGLKCWLMGYPVLTEPESVIGHRWQNTFTSYVVPEEFILMNRMRTAYKNYPTELWRRWLGKVRVSRTAEMWHRAWDGFTRFRGTAEVERIYLCQYGKHDLYWYGEYFGIILP